MSNATKPESMEEALASIHRIFRVEDGPGEAAGGEAADNDDRPPLLLTPEMRSDRGRKAGATSRPPDDEALRELVRELVREALAEELADGDAEAGVRAIIRDELMHGEIGGQIVQNVLNLARAEIAKGQGES